MALNFIPRSPKRKIATFIIGVGILLALPPFVNIFIIDDLLNVFIAEFSAKKAEIPMITAFISSYTLVAWSIIFIWFYIYPYNTERLMNGFMNMIKNGIRSYIKKIKDKPVNLIWAGIALFVFFKIYQWYVSRIGGA